MLLTESARVQGRRVGEIDASVCVCVCARAHLFGVPPCLRRTTKCVWVACICACAFLYLRGRT